MGLLDIPGRVLSWLASKITREKGTEWEEAIVREYERHVLDEAAAAEAAAKDYDEPPEEEIP